MNSLDLNDRVAVVTGGARGIGYAIAERILSSGGSVALWDVDAKALQTARSALASEAEVLTVAAELTDPRCVVAATRETLGRFGKIDILINNAGITGGNAVTSSLDRASYRSPRSDAGW